MGKKYHRYQALSGGGSTKNPNWAYEVDSGKIITYKVTESGFLIKNFNYEAIR